MENFGGFLMKSLFDYEFLVNEVFYKCWHILDYITEHPVMDELDKEAIQATIMDALVYKNLINPNRESLDFDNVCIRNDVDHYMYDAHPNICGIPQWMKEAFRKKCIVVSAGLPIFLFLSRPPDKLVIYCVYDPNTAVSAIFPDATFYNVFYTSPARGVRIDDQRPFVEVDIDGVPYLVDVLTKRIIKSSFFKARYGFEVRSQFKVSEMDEKNKEIYRDQTTERNSLDVMIPIYEMTLGNLSRNPAFAEMIYEFEKCRELYPEAFEKAEEFKRELNEEILI